MHSRSLGGNTSHQIWLDRQYHAIDPDAPRRDSHFENEELSPNQPLNGILPTPLLPTATAVGVQQHGRTPNYPHMAEPRYLVLQSDASHSQPLSQTNRRPLADLNANSLVHRPTRSTKPPRSRFHRDILTSRRPLQEYPLRFKVYYMPDGRHIHAASVVHAQKRQNGFFRHPILVIGLSKDTRYVHFYALTKAPPKAIRDLDMCLELGATMEEQGEDVLRLANGSQQMQRKTWVNLEQLFYIECAYLDYWLADVAFDIADFAKLEKKVIQLEAQQNRYIYKPLPRDMSSIAPGTIVMLPNPPASTTLGAPVIVLINHYPHFRFLRVKTLEDNINFEAAGTQKSKAARRLCLRIGQRLETGHDNTPVLVLEPDSPDMREPSYVEISRQPRWARLDKCKTWCFPHVRIQSSSMEQLWRYLEDLLEMEGRNLGEPSTITRTTEAPGATLSKYRPNNLGSGQYSTPTNASIPYSPHIPNGTWVPPTPQPYSGGSYQPHYSANGFNARLDGGCTSSSSPATPVPFASSSSFYQTPDMISQMSAARTDSSTVVCSAFASGLGAETSQSGPSNIPPRTWPGGK